MRPTVVGVPWAVCPHLVLVDKFHEVKNPETAIYCRLQDLRAHAEFPNQLKVMFLSATPISVSLHGIAAPLRATVPAA